MVAAFRDRFVPRWNESTVALEKEGHALLERLAAEAATKQGEYDVCAGACLSISEFIAI